LPASVGAGASYKRPSTGEAQSYRARPQTLAADEHRGMESRQSFRCRTCTPSCDERTCRDRQGRRKAVRLNVGRNRDRRDRGPMRLVVLMLVRSLRAPCWEFRQTCCFLFTLFASRSMNKEHRNAVIRVATDKPQTGSEATICFRLKRSRGPIPQPQLVPAPVRVPLQAPEWSCGELPAGP